MAAYENLILDSLRENVGEGTPWRLKKLRQSVIGTNCEQKQKDDFAEALDKLSSEEEGKLLVHNGMVTLLAFADTEPVVEEKAEDNQIGVAIEQALAALGGGPIRLKKLRQAVMNDILDDKDIDATQEPYRKRMVW